VGRANISHEIWRQGVVAKNDDRRTDVLERAEEVGPDKAVAELIAGHVPDDDVLEELCLPRPPLSGLAMQMLASMRSEIKFDYDSSLAGRSSNGIS
jgi:hypothetical protein